MGTCTFPRSPPSSCTIARCGMPRGKGIVGSGRSIAGRRSCTTSPRRSSACATARRTARCTRLGKRRRTSVFAGCTFMSTARGSSSTKSAYTGCTDGSMSPRNASRTACCSERSSIERPLMMIHWLRAEDLAAAGVATTPPMRIGPCSSGSSNSNERSSSSGAKPFPSTWTHRVRSSCGGRSTSGRPSLVRRKPIPGAPSAIASIASCTRPVSAAWLRRNLRRAGTLRKSVRTSTTVPAAPAAGRGPVTCPPSTSIEWAWPSTARRLVMRNCATLPMLARASPRKPKLATASRSSKLAILLVA